MSTPSMEYLNSMWQYVPQGHEKPLKQAFYNTIANIFIAIAAIVLVAAYFILAPFVRPLYWAVLCGTFLYPFKRSLTNVLRTWLRSLQSSGTPLAVGTVVLPFQVCNNLVESLTNSLWANVKLLLGVFLGLPLIYLLYHFALLRTLFATIWSFFGFLYDFMGYFSSLWVWTFFISYLLVVIFLWTPDSQRWLKMLTVPVWSALVLHVATVAGSLRVPLLILMVLVMVVGFVVEMGQAKASGDAGQSSPSFLSTLSSVLGFPSESEKQEQEATPTKTDTETVGQTPPAEAANQSSEAEKTEVTKPFRFVTSMLD